MERKDVIWRGKHLHICNHDARKGHIADYNCGYPQRGLYLWYSTANEPVTMDWAGYPGRYEFAFRSPLESAPLFRYAGPTMISKQPRALRLQVCPFTIDMVIKKARSDV